MPVKQTLPIDLYFWPTANGIKISIFLEEVGAPYSLHFVNISRGDQFDKEFLAVSPNNRIPAIVCREAARREIWLCAAVLFRRTLGCAGWFPWNGRVRSICRVFPAATPPCDTEH